MPKKKKPKPRLRQVNCRLFEEDVVFLEERAEKEVTSYQVLLRKLVNKAIRDQKNRIVL